MQVQWFGVSLLTAETLGKGRGALRDHLWSVSERGHGRPVPAVPVEARAGAGLGSALCWLIALAQLGAELNQALVPVLGQQEHEETQADDKDGDEAHRVELDVTGIQVHHCRGAPQQNIFKVWIICHGFCCQYKYHI